MKRMFLMKNPELFQGEKYLSTNKSYFEGWYFKISSDNLSIAFIPGININSSEKKTFIQIITNTNSYYVNYDINEFEYSFDPFYVRIGKNFFSKDAIHVEIEDDEQNLTIYGDVKYFNIKNIGTNDLYPNIMGPFSYVPFMECNHAILSMKSDVTGFVDINNNKINFNEETGYIEKDWGCSFPKSYIWCQGNNFVNSSASFMLSIAIIPFKIFNFRGIICSLIIGDKEYRFATYNNTKIVKYDIDNNLVDIILKKGNYFLEINSKCDTSLKLIAPVKGEMKKDILESISAYISITLKKDNKVIFSDTSKNCGLEIVV